MIHGVERRLHGEPVAGAAHEEVKASRGDVAKWKEEDTLPYGNLHKKWRKISRLARRALPLLKQDSQFGWPTINLLRHSLAAPQRPVSMTDRAIVFDLELPRQTTL